MTKDKNDLFKGQGRFVEMPESLCKMAAEGSWNTRAALTITPEDVERCAWAVFNKFVEMSKRQGWNLSGDTPIQSDRELAQAVLTEFVKGRG